MAELADARDLKSLGPKDRTGSIPVFGTKFKTNAERWFSYIRIKESEPMLRAMEGEHTGTDQDDDFDRMENFRSSAPIISRVWIVVKNFQTLDFLF